MPCVSVFTQFCVCAMPQVQNPSWVAHQPYIMQHPVSENHPFYISPSPSPLFFHPAYTDMHSVVDNSTVLPSYLPFLPVTYSSSLLLTLPFLFYSLSETVKLSIQMLFTVCLLQIGDIM